MDYCKSYRHPLFDKCINRMLGVLTMLFSCSVYASPNIVTIVLDDVSAYQVGYNNSFYETPHIDRLQRAGVAFDKAYAYPKCSPTRNALLTGRNPARIGATQVLGHIEKTNIVDGRDYIPLDEPTLSYASPYTHSVAHSMKQRGYQTAFVGKWHINYSAPPTGGSGYGYDKILNLKNIKKTGSGGTATCNGYDAHRNKEFTNNAIDWLNSIGRNSPFYLTMSFNAIHAPWCVDDGNVLNYFNSKGGQGNQSRNNPLQAAMMWEVDAQIGRLISHLESQNMLGNTVFIVYGDNGAYTENPENRFVRGSKGSLYQGGIQVPLVISGNVVNSPGRRAHNLVMPEDLFATTLGIASRAKPTDLPGNSDSIDFSRILWNPRVLTVRKGGVIHQPHYGLRAQNGRWKGGGVIPSTAYIQRPTFHANGAIRNHWKLIMNWESYYGGDGGVYELYDLASDPLETNNVSELFPKVRDKLLGKLTNWRNAGTFNLPWPKHEIVGDVWGVANHRTIWNQPQSGPFWKKTWLNVAGGLKHVSSGKNFVWGISDRDMIWKCAKPCTGQWQFVYGGLSQLDAGHDEVWGVNSRGNIFKRNVSGQGYWQWIPGNLKHVSAGDTYIWGVNSNDEIFKCRKPCFGAWQIVPGALKQVDVGNTEVWGVNSFGNIFKRAADGSGHWQRIGGILKHVSVGKKYIWGVNPYDDIFKCKRPCFGQWVQQPGKLMQVDAE